MITELSKLTMSQFIDILCGDTSSLGIGTPKQRAEVRNKLVSDYTMLSDPTGTSAYVGRRKIQSDDKATLLLFKVCNNLVVMGEYDEVRAILSEYGLNVDGMEEKRLALEVDRRMKRAKSMVERNAPGEDEDKETKTPEDIRRMFDRQAASLMTYFKFQIDLSTIKATTFAYMIDQADREIKAKKAAISG